MVVAQGAELFHLVLAAVGEIDQDQLGPDARRLDRGNALAQAAGLAHHLEGRVLEQTLHPFAEELVRVDQENVHGVHCSYPPSDCFNSVVRLAPPWTSGPGGGAAVRGCPFGSGVPRFE
ncbi:hypothetical protein [Roseomonas genomospecies 6]|uniref:hypothetical protein n=1 Tax=Roseomonas genomospecies 6 TaxID=214106 RepID=UPI0025701FD2|nr:hypothetical protein [Roseomonas genomospecies 6]